MTRHAGWVMGGAIVGLNEHWYHTRKFANAFFGRRKIWKKVIQVYCWPSYALNVCTLNVKSTFFGCFNFLRTYFGLQHRSQCSWFTVCDSSLLLCNSLAIRRGKLKSSWNSGAQVFLGSRGFLKRLCETCQEPRLFLANNNRKMIYEHKERILSEQFKIEAIVNV